MEIYRFFFKQNNINRLFLTDSPCIPSEPLFSEQLNLAGFYSTSPAIRRRRFISTQRIAWNSPISLYLQLRWRFHGGIVTVLTFRTKVIDEFAEKKIESARIRRASSWRLFQFNIKFVRC